MMGLLLLPQYRQTVSFSSQRFSFNKYAGHRNVNRVAFNFVSTVAFV